jgi:hypothetical protein
VAGRAYSRELIPIISAAQTLDGASPASLDANKIRHNLIAACAGGWL